MGIKGSWKRPDDPRYKDKEDTGDDYGRIGCKSGRGFHHPMRDGRCRYCNHTKEEIQKLQSESDTNKTL